MARLKVVHEIVQEDAVMRAPTVLVFSVRASIDTLVFFHHQHPA